MSSAPTTGTELHRFSNESYVRRLRWVLPAFAVAAVAIGIGSALPSLRAGDFGTAAVPIGFCTAMGIALYWILQCIRRWTVVCRPQDFLVVWERGTKREEVRCRWTEVTGTKVGETGGEDALDYLEI